MHQYQERDGEEEREPGGKTRFKELRKVWVRGRGPTGQNNVEE